MNVKRRLAMPVTVLLMCSTLATGITAAPGGAATARASGVASAGNAVMLAATNTPVATKTVTATTTMTATTTTTATLAVTPTVTNPSGLVTVAGSGFAPNDFREFGSSRGIERRRRFPVGAHDLLIVRDHSRLTRRGPIGDRDQPFAPDAFFREQIHDVMRETVRSHRAGERNVRAERAQIVGDVAGTP